MQRSAFLFLSLLFFCSGACALIYQVMWLRLLGLVFGVTVYAASTVLASFMGGLAIGSFTAGAVASRLRTPLRTFGYIEIAIGLSAVSTPLILDLVRDLWLAAQPSLPLSLEWLTPARLVATFAILIVPTTLMGATLPIVMRSALAHDAPASRIAWLYAINTGGAIVGAVTAGFVLVPQIGVTQSFQLAAVVNLLIGAAAIGASLLGVEPRALPQTRPAGAPANQPTPNPAPGHADAPGLRPQGAALSILQRRLILAVFAASGAMSLALEIIWFRMLTIRLRPTAYAFTVMLAVVLAGIALGSALATPAVKRGLRALPILTVVQLLLSLTAVLSLNALGSAEGVSTWLAPALTSLGIAPYVAPIIVASVLAILPTALLLGAAFPMGLSLWSMGLPDRERGIGFFYSVNVCGAIAGSIIGGFVLLPLAGSRGSLVVLASLALLSSVALALAQWRVRPNFAGFVAIVGPVAFVMSALNAVDPFTVAATPGSDRVLWREEGVQTTVAVHEHGGAGRRQRVMYLDGMHQASDLPQMAFVHHRIGALPMLLHPDPRRALVIGLGGGATAGAVARYPGVEVDVVELSSAVVTGARYFEHINFGLLDQPHVSLRVDDGRNYLLTTERRYDVITADIMLPRHAGAGALYSRDYFELVRSRLNPGGLVLQWNGGEGPTYRMILRAFLAAFPNTTLWADGTLMVGSVEPFTFSRTAFDARRAHPQFRALFDWDYDTLLGMYVAGPPEVAAWVGEGPVLSDDRPLIEYFLSLPTDEPPVDVATLRGRPRDISRPRRRRFPQWGRA